MRNVTVRQLQMFVASADTGSFTRAAELLRVSPAAVSFQIKQIEDGSGFSLFERIGKKVAPTDAGYALLGYARVVLQALHDADQSLMALRGVLETGEADDGGSFVDIAVGGDARRIFGDAVAIAERGFALIAAAGVDFIKFDHGGVGPWRGVPGKVARPRQQP